MLGYCQKIIIHGETLQVKPQAKPRMMPSCSRVLKTLRDRPEIGLLGLVAALSPALALACARADLPWTDCAWYHLMATQMAQGRGPCVFAGGETMVPLPSPGYPLVLSSFYKLFGAQPVVAGIVSAACLAGIVLFVGSAAARLADRRVGWISACLVAWCLPSRATCSSAMADPVGNLLWALFLWMIVRSALSKEPRLPALLSGALIGLAVLIKPNNALLLPVGLLWLMLSPRKVKNLIEMGLAGLPFLALLLLWNTALMGHPFLTSYGHYTVDYRPSVKLLSLVNALPNPTAEGVEDLLGHFLLVPYMLVGGGKIAGEGFVPIVLLSLFSLRLWADQQRLRTCLILCAVVALHWAELSVYAYFSDRYFVPAFFALVLLAAPLWPRLLETLGAVWPRLGRWAALIVVLVFLAPAVERGTRDSVSGKLHEDEQGTLCRWIKENVEPDAILISAWQILLERETGRTCLTFWDALDRTGALSPLLRTGRPIYVQMDWYASHMDGPEVIQALRGCFDAQEIPGPHCRFLKLTPLTASPG